MQGNENSPATANVLIDDVLLEIFNFYRGSVWDRWDHNQSPYYRTWDWQLLAHVCRRWRQIIFASACRLDLRLLCKEGTPVRKHLDIWPAIPILMRYDGGINPADEDNVIAALEHPDRVCCAALSVTGVQLAKISAMLQQSFPVLKELLISSEFPYNSICFLPSGLLGGSAPCLQELNLVGIAFPSLPTFLLSASDLVELYFRDIPRAGYISPAMMAAHLAALPRLKTFHLCFQCHFDGNPSHPVIRSIIPSLRHLKFVGDSEYLEAFLEEIDTPQLVDITIYYWAQDFEFSVPQLFGFTNRSETLKQILSGHCQIMVFLDAVYLNIGASPTPNPITPEWEWNVGISVSVSGADVDKQVSDLADILSSSSPVLSDVVHLTIETAHFDSEIKWMSEAWDVWLLLLRRFSSVRTLFVSDHLAFLISQILEHVDEEMIHEILPALELLYLTEDKQEQENRPISSVHMFADLRRGLGLPVILVKTKAEFEERLETYDSYL